MIAGVVRKKPSVVPMQTATATAGEMNMAEEYGNMACERERHRAEHDAGHEHRNNDAYRTEHTGEHHVVQATAFHHQENFLSNSVFFLLVMSIPQNHAPVKTPVNAM